jgi:hypothetical protein
MRNRPTVALLIAGTFLASILSAQTPRGAEIRVSPLAGDAPARAAVATNGDFVVTWQAGVSYRGQAPKVWYRLFRADGAPKGKPQRVSTSKAGEFRPAVSLGADGSFVIVWYGGDSRDTSVFGRRFDPQGRPIGGRFLLSANTEGSQFGPAVALTADGGFVAAWASALRPYDERSSDLYARRFDAAGQPLGPEFLVTNTTWNEQSTPQVVVKPDGGFLIGWLNYGGEPTFYDSFARIFAADGAPLGDEFQLNSGDTMVTSQPEFALAAADDGTFVAVWTDNAGDYDRDGNSFGDIVGLRGQRFAADGTPIGDFFHVNASAKDVQDNPAIVMVPGGGFLVAWTSQSATVPYTSAVMGRRFASNAVPAGPELRINTSTQSQHWAPTLALAPSGKGVVAWIAWQGSFEQSGVLLRRLQ